MSALATLIDRFRRPSGPRPKKWDQSTREMPWFDQPDALQVLEQRRRDGRYDDQQYQQLKKWINDGYVVVRNLIPNDLIDAMLGDLDSAWTADKPIPGLVINDLKLPGAEPTAIAHEKLIELPIEQRLQMRDSQNWRVHAFCLYSRAANDIFQNRALKDTCSLIFDREAAPQYTINFMYGSRQHLHQDMCVFHIVPRNYLIGAWIACEDIGPDCGPLVYYPGSHKEPLYSRFDNYPQTNLKTCDKETSEAYREYLDRTAEKYERKEFLAKKGDILLWHGMLIHGGAPVNNPSLTRKSLVIHYIPPGMNKENEIVGPFNW